MNTKNPNPWEFALSANPVSFDQVIAEFEKSYYCQKTVGEDTYHFQLKAQRHISENTINFNVRVIGRNNGPVQPLPWGSWTNVRFVNGHRWNVIEDVFTLPVHILEALRIIDGGGHE